MNLDPNGVLPYAPPKPWQSPHTCDWQDTYLASWQRGTDPIYIDVNDAVSEGYSVAVHDDEGNTYESTIVQSIPMMQRAVTTYMERHRTTEPDQKEHDR